VVLHALNLNGEWASLSLPLITMIFVVVFVIATRLISIRAPSFRHSQLPVVHHSAAVVRAVLNGTELPILRMFGAYTLFIGGA
jgi:hypothetical protein